MKNNPTKSALIVIDMEKGFVEKESAHCIRYAADTIPNCVKAVEAAREKGIPVFFVKRIYRRDGSDVELTRYDGWKKGGRSMGPESTGFNSAEAVKGLEPKAGDYTIIKPRWSAFFHTELDLILRRLKIETVILMGTTTPNCIRSTCYDANSLDYQVVVLKDCCSSMTEEIQRVNIGDMERMGAVILSSREFMDYNENTIENVKERIYQEMLESGEIPEIFREMEGGLGWFDRW